FGSENLEKKIPASVSTKFRIGSVSKQFTAAAILKLQEEGKLSVSDKLSKFLPDFPRGDEVTLEHLLIHTSGIKSYTSKPGFVATMTKPTTEIDLINSFKNDPYDFDPGDRYSYNNSGYFLLGHIVGNVSGKGYADYLQEAFFTPLGMSNSGVHSPELDLEHEAVGYKIENRKPSLATDWHMSQAGGAGAIYSTISDLHKWNEALFNGKVLSADSLQMAHSPKTLNDGSLSNYGYGWAIGSHRGLQTINHSGGLDGFLSYLIRYPSENTTIVVFVNASPTGHLPPPTEIAKQLGETVLWEKMDEQAVRVVNKSVDSSTFQDFVGLYDYGAPILLDVTLVDEQLYAQLTGQNRFPIYPLDDNTFFWKVVDAEAEFVRDEDGKVTSVIHRQNGSVQTHKRIPDAAKVVLTDEQLEAFVGTYDYVSAVMRVTRDGNQLYAQLTGQAKFKIYPQSERKFAWAGIKAEVEFVKDDNGNVTKGIHTQGGRTFDVARVPEIQQIELTEEQLDEFVGRYNYGLLLGNMTVTRDGKKLTAKLRGQNALEIVPVGNDEFRWKEVNASIKFERNEEGKIVRGLHTQGGKTRKVPRVK
ncbi:MAG: serine hydrolase, partial [Planctomycetales bacterium]|nr:serine hydrolase [Planctomycetales bacterium]